MRHAATLAGENTFLGWLDEPLSRVGLEEARHAGALLVHRRLTPTAVFTSVLGRAVTTAEAALAAADLDEVCPQRSWRLNERHYGALQGRAKSEVRAEVGPERFQAWRRSIHGLPPRDTTERHEAMVRAYRDRGVAISVPWTESFAMVRDRVVPYFEREILTALREGGTALVVAHSAAVRALVAHLERTPSKQVPNLDVPRAMPMLFEYDASFRQLGSGRYLEPGRAADAARAVAREGSGQ